RVRHARAVRPGFLPGCGRDADAKKCGARFVRSFRVSRIVAKRGERAIAQCQTNPDGRCTMEPPCLPGECYLYSVAMKMHAESAGEVSDDQDVARERIVGTITYQRGPYTENEPWDRNKLALVNALLDTLVP